MPKCVELLTALLLRDRSDLVIYHTHRVCGGSMNDEPFVHISDLFGSQTLTQGRVRSTNDLIVALAGENNRTQHETACMYVETKKRPLPLNCRQAIVEAILFGLHSRNPVVQASRISSLCFKR